MKRARKVSNVHGEVRFKQKTKAYHCLYWKIYSLTENSPIKAQKISLLISCMPLTCNSTKN